MVRKIIATLLVLVSPTVLSQQAIKIESERALKVQGDFQQRVDARFRLFETRNYWNYLQLDTATGRLWQVQFSVDKKQGPSARFPINTRVLADGKPGRFTLYETRNNWNYLLVDQEDGRVWRAQFTLSAEDFAGIRQIFDAEREKE